MKKKKPNIKTIIRKIVREEVAMAIKEVITELRQPSQSKPTQSKSIQEKHYSKNSVLNDILNETANSEEWKTMGGGTYDSSRANEVLSSQYGDMMNQQPQQVPSSDPMSQFLNKDYSEVLEKSIEKSKMKSGR